MVLQSDHTSVVVEGNISSLILWISEVPKIVECLEEGDKEMKATLEATTQTVPICVFSCYFGFVI